MSTELIDLWDRLNQHDWYFERSDDHRVWEAGHRDWEAIRTIARATSGGEDLLNSWLRHRAGKESKPPRPTQEAA